MEPDNVKVPAPFFVKELLSLSSASTLAVTPDATFAVTCDLNPPVVPVIDPLCKSTEAALLLNAPISNVPPLIVTACPAKLLATPADNFPALTMIPPVKVFAELLRLKSPAPVLVKPPVPANPTSIVPPEAATLVLVNVPTPVIEPPDMVKDPLLALVPKAKEPLERLIESEVSVALAPTLTSAPLTRSVPATVLFPFKLTWPPDAKIPSAVVVSAPVEVSVPAELVTPAKEFALFPRTKVPPVLFNVEPVKFPPVKFTTAELLPKVTAPAEIPPASTAIVALESKAALSPELNATGEPAPSVNQFVAVVFQAPSETAESQT